MMGGQQPLTQNCMEFIQRNVDGSTQTRTVVACQVPSAQGIATT